MPAGIVEGLYDLCLLLIGERLAFPHDDVELRVGQNAATVLDQSI